MVIFLSTTSLSSLVTSVATDEWYSNWYELRSATCRLFLHAYETDFLQKLMQICSNKATLLLA